MKLTNPKAYTAKPAAGVLKPGQAATIQINGRPDMCKY